MPVSAQAQQMPETDEKVDAENRTPEGATLKSVTLPFGTRIAALNGGAVPDQAA